MGLNLLGLITSNIHVQVNDTGFEDMTAKWENIWNCEGKLSSRREKWGMGRENM